jgi:hypothetical protein
VGHPAGERSIRAGLCLAGIAALVLAAILFAAGTALVFKADIFQWNLRSETSLIFGFIYLGAAVFFIYGFLQPYWSNAAPQLIGFLAYDIVLIGPFVDRFDEVSGRQLLSLSIYTAVPVLSGALAFYFLFLSDAAGPR